MFFSDVQMWSSLLNSVIWTIGNVGIQLILAMLVALLLDQQIKGKRAWEMLIIIPWAMSTFGYVFTWKWMLDPVYGVINYFLIWFRIITIPISWLGTKNLALPSVIGMGIWNGFPFLVVVFAAGLQTIPQSDYDVAHIAGASFLQIFRYVILPRLRRIIGIVVILKIIWYFNNFDLIFIATGGGPLKVTETYPIYTYRKAWDEMFMGRGATTTMLLLALLIIMSIVYFRLFRIED
jgi:multiple sugar transport system permease protein